MSMTLRRNANPEQAAPDGQPPEAETQMRRALGLLPSATPSGAPRARLRGGDGPVVEHRGDRHTGSSVNRVAAAEAALADERHAREQIARQLRDAETALREAQTKRGHAELARDEAIAALAAERSAREAAEEQLKELQAAAQTPVVEGPPPAEPAMVTSATRNRAPVATDYGTPAKRRGRPPGSVSKTTRSAPAAKAPDQESDESGPVEWWVPGWKERI
jgi:hypothetical protein